MFDAPVVLIFEGQADEVSMMTKIALAVALGLGTAACAPFATEVAVATPANNAGPPGWVAPGVQMVGGWDDPVFWANDSYWWWGGNGWMTWGGAGWMWAQPPLVLSAGVREPWHYRGWGVRDRVRDHRVNGSAGAPGRWTQPAGRWSGDTRGGSWNRGPSWNGARGGAVFRDHRRR